MWLQVKLKVRLFLKILVNFLKITVSRQVFGVLIDTFGQKFWTVGKNQVSLLKHAGALKSL